MFKLSRKTKDMCSDH